MAQSPMIELWDAIKYGAGIALGWLAWAFRGQSKKIDDLQREKLDEKVFNNSLKALRQDFKDHSIEVRQDIKEIREKVDRIVEQQNK